MHVETNGGSGLLERHRDNLTLLARWLLRQAGPADALRPKLDPDDLVQQTLLEALPEEARLRERPDAEVLAYLRRVLRNNVLDAARKFAGGPERDEAALCRGLQESSLRLEAWLAAAHSTPSERAARHEELGRLAEALGELPATQRQAVELKYLHGASVADVSRIMGLSEAAVGGLLRRGMSGLRQRLTGPD